MKKNILIVQPSTLLGGAKRQAALLSVLLSEEFNVDFLSFHHNNDELETQQLLKGTNVNSLLIKSVFPSNYFNKFFRFTQLALFLLKHKYDYVFAYQYEMNFAVGILRSLGLVKTAIWNQRDEGFNCKLKPTVAFALKKYDLFISNSVGGACFLQTTLNIPNSKINVINNAVKISVNIDRATWRKEYGFLDDDILICMVANIHKSKDHVTLVKALKHLIDDGYSCKLLFFGYKGNSYESVKTEIYERNLESFVIFMGPINDVASALNACDISILSSPSEGLSNTMLESMYVGVPFIGTRIKGITSVLGNNYSYLFSVGNSEEAAEVIKQVLNDKEKTQAEIEKCKKIVMESYSLENLKKQTINALNSIVK